MQFFENGELAASQDVGIRIHGGATRSYSQKSFNIYARGGYGAPKLEYDLFSGKVMSKSVGKPVTVFDTFVLRNGGNDAMYTRFSESLSSRWCQTVSSLLRAWSLALCSLTASSGDITR